MILYQNLYNIFDKSQFYMHTILFGKLKWDAVQSVQPKSKLATIWGRLKR